MTNDPLLGLASRARLSARAVMGIGLALASLAVTLAATSAPRGGDTPPAATRPESVSNASDAAAKLTLSSPQISQGKAIPADQAFNGSGCTGKNISPALSWSGAPVGTKSFALMVHDPDAPTGGKGFWHWVVYDIPVNTTSLPADAGDPKKGLMPAGAVQAHNDFGTPGYGGPCPPPGKPHHYHFRLYALSVSKLGVDPEAPTPLINARINTNKLAEADLMGLYRQ